MTVELAARLGAVTGPVHGFIYFSTEARDEYGAIAMPANTQYFGSRAAPFGSACADLVIATFYNFKPALVRDAIPAAWEAATPAAIQQARMTAAGKVLGTVAGDLDQASVAEATDLATRMADGVGYEGRPLAAANRTVALPDDPLTRLWQLTTIIREWRGDAHIGALISADLDAVEALVLHVGTGAFPAKIAKATRGWTDAEWDAGIDRLASRGLVEEAGELTTAGSQYREAIEQKTNELCLRLVSSIGATDTDRLIALLDPIKSGLMASGVFARFPRPNDE